MTFLDAYGLVALVADEAAAPEVEALLRAGECRIAAVNFAEAVDVCQRQRGVAPEEVRDALEPLTLSGALGVAASDESEAWLAAALRGRYYHREQSALSLADCFLLAHAVSAGEPLATADPPLAQAARSENVEVVALPDTAGRRP